MCMIRNGGSFLEWAALICSNRTDREEAGFLFVRPVRKGTFESTDFILLPGEKILRQTADVVIPDPLSLIWACRQAKDTNTVLCMVHSHLRQSAVFSTFDDIAERRMAPQVMKLTGTGQFGSVVIASESHNARMWVMEGSTLVEMPLKIQP